MSSGTYYYYYGTYYARSGDAYEVVDAPAGALVDGLPEGYKVVEKGGIEYYSWEGNYYREVETDEFSNGVGYELVNLSDSYLMNGATG